MFLLPRISILRRCCTILLLQPNWVLRKLDCLGCAYFAHRKVSCDETPDREMRKTSGNWDLPFDVPMSYKLGLEVLLASCVLKQFASRVHLWHVEQHLCLVCVHDEVGKAQPRLGECRVMWSHHFSQGNEHREMRHRRHAWSGKIQPGQDMFLNSLGENEDQLTCCCL